MGKSKIYSDEDFKLAGKIAEMKYGLGYSHSFIAQKLKIDQYKVTDIVRHMHRGGAILVNITLLEEEKEQLPKQLFCNQIKYKGTWERLN